MKHTTSFTVMIAICSLFYLSGCGNSQKELKEKPDNIHSSISDMNNDDDIESGNGGGSIRKNPNSIIMPMSKK